VKNLPRNKHCDRTVLQLAWVWWKASRLVTGSAPTQSCKSSGPLQCLLFCVCHCVHSLNSMHSFATLAGAYGRSKFVVKFFERRFARKVTVRYRQISSVPSFGIFCRAFFCSVNLQYRSNCYLSLFYSCSYILSWVVNGYTVWHTGPMS